MHKALYRIFRPMTFSDVVGQEHITRTLKNQIADGNIAHAYLFCGTRGTGKTSTAKIFSRGINCISPNGFEPCNSCEVCKGIIDESIMDVVEIDAASNNGVDDVRELRENVKYPPSRGRYKVYIIDEVHMLSQGAFNALLKTLEEPPSHVVFILATTEVHKLPATILSRCQRFEFKRLSLSDTVERMKYICDQIGVCANEKALSLIAMSAQGAMRDALSVLDQCISYTGECISYEDVVSILGTVDYKTVYDMADGIIGGNVKSCLEILNEIVIWGKDLRHFTHELIEHFRNIMVMKLGSVNTEMLQLTQEMSELAFGQSGRITQEEVIRNIKLLSAVQNDIKYSNHPRIMLEVALMKLCTPSKDESVQGLLARISRLERFANSPQTYSQKHRDAASNTEKFNKAKNDESGVQSSEAAGESYPNSVASTELKDGSDRQSQVHLKGDADIADIWKNILRVIKDDKRVPVQAMLKEGKPGSIENGVLVVVFRDDFDFHRKALSKVETLSYINGVLKRVTGQAITARLILESEISASIEQTVEAEEDKGLEILRNVFPEDMIEIVDSDE